MDPLRLLLEGELEIHGRLVVSSNDALFCSVRRAADDPAEPPELVRAVYKPIRFERPLWDFPDGTLAQREVAAYLVSEATGWGIVPPTVLRDGPAGPGMVQLWIDGAQVEESDDDDRDPDDPADANPADDPDDDDADDPVDADDPDDANPDVAPDDPADAWQLVRTADPRLRPMAIFDAVVNNTDRKGGHILPVLGPMDGPLHIYGVDHGVCFSAEPKLRTVLWAWRGTPLSAEELAVLSRLRADLDGDLGSRLRALLLPGEVLALFARVDSLLTDGRFPLPPSDRPAIPWPPF